MKELPLTLNDFEFPKTKVNVEEIRKFASEDQFMSLAVELLKEVAQITALLACTYRLDSEGNPRKWKRNEAVVGGLMVRISKLQMAFLDQMCQNRMEIANIISRSLAEGIFNLIYLLKNRSDELFDEYIDYSLKTESQFNVVEPIGNVVIKNVNGIPIRIKDVAYVEDSYQEQTEIIRNNGKHGVILRIQKT